MPGALRLERRGKGGLPFVTESERRRGFDKLVARWKHDRHLPAPADGRHAYFIAWQDDAPVGFVILRDRRSLGRVALVRRAAS